MLNSKLKRVLQLKQQDYYQANPPYLILSFDENYFSNFYKSFCLCGRT